MTKKECQDNYNLALVFIKQNLNKTDIQIAEILINDFSEFKEKKLESTRRYVCMIRTENNLTVKKSSDELYKDIDIFRKKFPHDTQLSIAGKLHLKYPEYSFMTLANYIKLYANWNHKKKFRFKHS